jgi:hypothetical protein
MAASISVVQNIATTAAGRKKHKPLQPSLLPQYPKGIERRRVLRTTPALV